MGLRRFMADEMSTGQGRRLAAFRALGAAGAQFGAPQARLSPLVARVALFAGAARHVELSKLLLAQGARLEAAAVGGDRDAARALLRAYEQLGAFPEYAEQVLMWLGRLGHEPALFGAVSSALSPTASPEQRHRALHQRVVSAIAPKAIALLLPGLEARWAGQPTAYNKVLGTVTRTFRAFDAVSAFVELAALKPELTRR